MIFTGGRNIGSCAEGFGVCCACEKLRMVFSKRDPRMNECSSTFPVTLECGDTSSQNVTYLVEESASPSDVGPSCTYHICPTDKNVCRIRLDLVAFNIAPPVTGLVIDGDDAETLQVGRTFHLYGKRWECFLCAFVCRRRTEARSATAPPTPSPSPAPAGWGRQSSADTIPGSTVWLVLSAFSNLYPFNLFSLFPVFVDASDEGCNVVAFSIGSGDSRVRQWDISGAEKNQ